MAEPKVINWGCGEHPFLLRIGECEALDDLTPAGMADFRWRLSQGIERGALAHAPVKTREVIDCIRLGLIGGGMKREDAERRVKEAFINGDVSELNLLAFTIISNSLRAKEHDPLGEETAAENPPE